MRQYDSRMIHVILHIMHCEIKIKLVHLVVYYVVTELLYALYKCVRS